MAAVTSSSKVRFGVSNLTLWPLTADGTDSAAPTYGNAISIPGTVEIEVEYDGNDNTFHADNGKYWTGYSSSGNSGSIENAVFPNEVKAHAYGWRVDANGGLVEVENGTPGRFAMAYQVEGDADSIRVVHYDVSLGFPKVTHKTTEDNITPDTEKIDWSGKAQNCSGEKVTRYSLPQGGTGYSTWFSAPVMPAA